MSVDCGSWGAEAIAAILPHGKEMSLLDKIIYYDQLHICCQSSAHLRDDNVLLGCDEFSALAGSKRELHAALLVEFGAQAAAVHGVLAATENEEGVASLKYIGAVKSLQFAVDDIAGIEHPLLIEAERLHESIQGVIYQFFVKTSNQQLCSGRMVLLEP